jgi:hypothetical protein
MAGRDESGYETPPSQKDALAGKRRNDPQDLGANRLGRAGELDEGQGGTSVERSRSSMKPANSRASKW